MVSFEMVSYLIGGVAALLALRVVWRRWRTGVDVPPLSERWLAERRGIRNTEP
jgi:hypothetical protein